MNDPNGLLLFKGRCHVFAQWGEGGHSGASWLHAVSGHLATWQLLCVNPRSRLSGCHSWTMVVCLTHTCTLCHCRRSR